ncbi:MAG: hypothetical protein GY801_07155 [bacterium]|nr:hypothetical protein [bacterium]
MKEPFLIVLSSLCREYGKTGVVYLFYDDEKKWLNLQNKCLCPNQQTLLHVSTNRKTEAKTFRGQAGTCTGCPFRE